MAITERDLALDAILEGILAAYNATVHERNDPFTDCRTYAEAALANLEASGFKVIRNADRT